MENRIFNIIINFDWQYSVYYNIILIAYLYNIILIAWYILF